eukprot:752302-Hanusia_phi.AAC.5
MEIYFPFLFRQSHPKDNKEARGMILSKGRDIIAEGLCPGVTHWCERCRGVKLLIDSDGWLDIGEAILNTIHDHQKLGMVYNSARSP